MSRKIFLTQFSVPGGGNGRTALILAESGDEAFGVANLLREPHEKVSVTEAHEPVYEAFGASSYSTLYEGLPAPGRQADDIRDRITNLANTAGQPSGT